MTPIETLVLFGFGLAVFFFFFSLALVVHMLPNEQTT